MAKIRQSSCCSTSEKTRHCADETSSQGERIQELDQIINGADTWESLQTQDENTDTDEDKQAQKLKCDTIVKDMHARRQPLNMSDRRLAAVVEVVYEDAESSVVGTRSKLLSPSSSNSFTLEDFLRMEREQMRCNYLEKRAKGILSSFRFLRLQHSLDEGEHYRELQQRLQAVTDFIDGLKNAANWIDTDNDEDTVVGSDVS